MSFRLATWFQVIEFWSAAEWSNCNVSVSLASKLARALPTDPLLRSEPAMRCGLALSFRKQEHDS